MIHQFFSCLNSTGCLISKCHNVSSIYRVFEIKMCQIKGICMFIGNGHLTFDLQIWLKVTSLTSTASVLIDGRISPEILSFCSKICFVKTSKEGDFSHQFIDSKGQSGFENLSGLNDLNRHDNCTGLNDLNSLFGLKNRKLLALYTLSDFPGIRNLSSLNDLNNLTALASMTSTSSFHQKKMFSLMFRSTLAPK